MADQPRNVRDADEDAKPQPGATAIKQDTRTVQTEPNAKPQPGAKPANDAPAKPAADTPESKPTEEPEPEDPRIADLQAKLAAATAQASAVVALANADLPVSLAGLVAAGGPDDIESKVEALAQAVADAAAQKNAPAQLSLPPDADESEEDMQDRARRIFA
jgi:hypothetical protein|nr:MAG TPA: protein of unknown function (DUF4355) [Caudoviricetes sp.]